MKKIVMLNLDYILKYLLVRPDKFNITIINIILLIFLKQMKIGKILKYLSLQGYNNCDKIIENYVISIHCVYQIVIIWRGYHYCINH